MRRRVAIVGAGIVSSLGHSVADAFARLKVLRNCVQVSESLATYKGLHTALWAPSGYVRPESYTRKVVRTMSPVSEMALFATEQALRDAGLAEDVATLKGGRLGIAYGSCSGGVEANLDFASILVSREVKNVTSATYLKMMPQTTAVNLSVHFGTTGRLLPTGTACTSGSLAIGEAYETIASGKQDVMIAGGAEEFSVTQVAVFDTLFSTSCLNETPEKTPCAFDKSRTGLVIGDGAATLILEEMDRARARGARILAEVVGFGLNTDGRHVTQPNAETMARALALLGDWLRERARHGHDAGRHCGGNGHAVGVWCRPGPCLHDQELHGAHARRLRCDRSHPDGGDDAQRLVCAEPESRGAGRPLRRKRFHPG